MKRIELEIPGMTCALCARHVESTLREAGADSARVDWRRGRAAVEGPLDGAALERALASTDYRAAEIRWAGGDGAGASPDYDLVVVGSGGGAFAGAIRARDLGRRVLMVEHGTTGGTCVNVGCIPSKPLLVRSERARRSGTPTLPEALAPKRELVERLRQEKYVDLLEGLKLAAQTFERDVAKLSCCAA